MGFSGVPFESTVYELTGMRWGREQLTLDVSLLKLEPC